MQAEDYNTNIAPHAAVAAEGLEVRMVFTDAKMDLSGKTIAPHEAVAAEGLVVHW